jgi:hypothetical protein
MEMLQFYIDELDWEYGAGSIPYSPFEIYQESVLFSLYILHKKGYKPRSRSDYFDFFRKALLRDLPKDNEILMAVYVTMYEKLIIVDFFARFGLVDLDYQPESLPDEVKNTERIIKPTPLFKKLFKWKI